MTKVKPSDEVDIDEIIGQLEEPMKKEIEEGSQDQDEKTSFINNLLENVVVYDPLNRPIQGCFSGSTETEDISMKRDDLLKII